MQSKDILDPYATSQFRSYGSMNDFSQPSGLASKYRRSLSPRAPHVMVPAVAPTSAPARLPTGRPNRELADLILSASNQRLSTLDQMAHDRRSLPPARPASARGQPVLGRERHVRSTSLMRPRTSSVRSIDATPQLALALHGRGHSPSRRAAPAPTFTYGGTASPMLAAPPAPSTSGAMASKPSPPSPSIERLGRPNSAQPLSRVGSFGFIPSSPGAHPQAQQGIAQAPQLTYTSRHHSSTRVASAIENVPLQSPLPIDVRASALDALEELLADEDEKVFGDEGGPVDADSTVQTAERVISLLQRQVAVHYAVTQRKRAGLEAQAQALRATEGRLGALTAAFSGVRGDPRATPAVGAAGPASSRPIQPAQLSWALSSKAAARAHAEAAEFAAEAAATAAAAPSPSPVFPSTRPHSHPHGSLSWSPPPAPSLPLAWGGRDDAYHLPSSSSGAATAAAVACAAAASASAAAAACVAAASLSPERVDLGIVAGHDEVGGVTHPHDSQSPSIVDHRLQPLRRLPAAPTPHPRVAVSDGGQAQAPHASTATDDDGIILDTSPPPVASTATRLQSPPDAQASGTATSTAPTAVAGAPQPPPPSAWSGYAHPPYGWYPPGQVSNERVPAPHTSTAAPSAYPAYPYGGWYAPPYNLPPSTYTPYAAPEQLPSAGGGVVAAETAQPSSSVVVVHRTDGVSDSEGKQGDAKPIEKPTPQSAPSDGPSRPVPPGPAAAAAAATDALQPPQPFPTPRPDAPSAPRSTSAQPQARRPSNPNPSSTPRSNSSMPAKGRPSPTSGAPPRRASGPPEGGARPTRLPLSGEPRSPIITGKSKRSVGSVFASIFGRKAHDGSPSHGRGGRDGNSSRPAGRTPPRRPSGPPGQGRDDARGGRGRPPPLSPRSPPPPSRSPVGRERRRSLHDGA